MSKLFSAAIALFVVTIVVAKTKIQIHEENGLNYGRFPNRVLDNKVRRMLLHRGRRFKSHSGNHWTSHEFPNSTDNLEFLGRSEIDESRDSHEYPDWSGSHEFPISRDSLEFLARSEIDESRDSHEYPDWSGSHESMDSRGSHKVGNRWGIHHLPIRRGNKGHGNNYGFHRSSRKLYLPPLLTNVTKEAIQEAHAILINRIQTKEEFHIKVNKWVNAQKTEAAEKIGDQKMQPKNLKEMMKECMKKIPNKVKNLTAEVSEIKKNPNITLKQKKENVS